jgi:hypothetical protein
MSVILDLAKDINRGGFKGGNTITKCVKGVADL